jgi:hypothetical protein
MVTMKVLHVCSLQTHGCPFVGQIQFYNIDFFIEAIYSTISDTPSGNQSWV